MMLMAVEVVFSGLQKQDDASMENGRRGWQSTKRLHGCVSGIHAAGGAWGWGAELISHSLRGRDGSGPPSTNSLGSAPGQLITSPNHRRFSSLPSRREESNAECRCGVG